MSISIYCDGGSRGNPGKAASAFSVLDENKNTIYEQGFYLGIKTNNQAEYQAVVEALSWLIRQPKKYEKINFYLDSLLVVNQIKGIYKIKDQELKNKYNEISSIINKNNLKIENYSYIPRALNSRADALVNQTLDSSIGE